MKLIFIRIWSWRGLLYMSLHRGFLWSSFLALFITRWVILRAFIPMQERMCALSVFGDAYSYFCLRIEAILMDDVLPIGMRSAL